MQRTSQSPCDMASMKLLSCCCLLLISLDHGCHARQSTFAAAASSPSQMVPSFAPLQTPLENQLLEREQVLLQIRGGEQPKKRTKLAETSEQQPKKKRKKKTKTGRTKRSTTQSTTTDAANPSPATKDNNTNNNRQEINKVLLQQDPAQFLGQAIRDRGDELLLQSIDVSIHSLKWGLGASDYYYSQQHGKTASASADDEQDAASLVSPTAVIAQYFVKSHGGAHAFQTLCSLLSTVAGLGALLLSASLPALHDATDSSSTLSTAYAARYLSSLHLVRRACLWAMIQHVSGLLAAAVVAAQAIPQVGLRKARLYMSDLVRDPVAQYVFVAASVVAWLPAKTATTATTKLEWWMMQSSSWIVPLILVGPILLRELVSVGLVISDVLVLSTLGSSQEDSTRRLILRSLAVVRIVTDAFMSLLVTPGVWKNADAGQRQAILAKLTSKVSLVLELAIGVLMLLDAMWAALGCLLFATQRPPFLNVIKRMLCAHLFLVFLSTRRRKIERLATSMRGGASQLPFYVLNVLLHPRESMGIEDSEKRRPAPPLEVAAREDGQSWRWKNMLGMMLSLNDDA